MNRNLSDEGNDLLLAAWEEQKEALKKGIDEVLEKGSANKEVLWVMKELLDEGIVKPRKKTIEEYFEEQERLGK